MATRYPRNAPVLVGVDGSEPSLTAVDLAVSEATQRHRPLHVVHAFAWPLLRMPLSPSPIGLPVPGLHDEAHHILDEAVARATTAAPTLTVTGEVITGGPAPVLLRCARTAALTVIGNRGAGAFAGLLAGSVAIHLAAHATTAILVARGTAHADGAVVLGVDGSPANQRAVGYAFETASLRKAPLIAVHAWKEPVSTGPGDMLPLVYDPVALHAAEQRVLAEALAGWHAKYPDVTVHHATPRDAARNALISASHQAQLIVVGARGRGGVAGLLLGSVSQAVLHHAACPVAVIPHDGHP